MTKLRTPKIWLLATAALVFGSHMSASAQDNIAYDAGAPTMVAAAPSLPSVPAEQIARDVTSEFNPRTGVRELIAAPFDPFEEDPYLAASLRLRSADGVVAIMGADCSGVTTAIANNVGIPNGVTMISPSATSPALTTIEDNGNFFRVVPSDARQGQVLADVLKARGVDTVAVTYTNNDYGKGLSDSFASAFEAAGGKIEMTAAHEDGKADYSAEVGALAASGAEHLVVFGYVDQGGKGIVQASIDTDAFSNFYGGDGMVGDSLIEALSLIHI